jgi:hypothetical protein
LIVGGGALIATVSLILVLSYEVLRGSNSKSFPWKSIWCSKVPKKWIDCGSFVISFCNGSQVVVFCSVYVWLGRKGKRN